MGLNVHKFLLPLCKVFQVSAKSSYTFLQKHPLISGVLFFFFILYLFLSYIFSFLAYLSPFLVCGSIFVRIFWSSEKTELKYAKKKDDDKGEKKRDEPKYQNTSNNTTRRDLLRKYPSQNATTRGESFRDKKWDEYGGLEENAKDLSEVFQNEFTKSNKEDKDAKYFEKGENSCGLSSEKSKAHRRKTLRSEPSMIDLVEMDNEKIEDENDDDDDDDDDEDVRSEEDRNKAIEWNEDDQKNLMVLGFSEMEKNKRLESLIARRREGKLMKMQLENGLIDTKSIAPLFIAKSNVLDSPNNFEGLEIPGSAPSYIPRSPYDIRDDNYEDRPCITRENFDQEFIFNQRDIAFCRHESFSLGLNIPSESKANHGARDYNSFLHNQRKYSDRLAYPRSRWLSDKGNHDWLIDQLLYTEGSGFQADNAPREGAETTHEENEQCKMNMDDMKNDKVENSRETKSMSETSRISEKLGLRFRVPHQRFLKFPISTSSTLNEEQIPSPFDKKHDLFSNHRRICHTPTYSIASDLQVEVSEVGSSASTIEEIAETNSTTDRDSIIYDGDIDRNVSSGSEELWEASFHGRGEAQGVTAEGNNNSSMDITSPICERQIDEENVAGVSSFSSKYEMLDNTPTYAMNSDHIFDYMQHSVGEIEAPQSSNSPHVSSPQKGFIDSSVDHLHNETNSEKIEEWNMLSQNFINEAEVNNEMNNSTAIDQHNTQNSLLVLQESIDETSTSSVASSPRSVLPDPMSPVNNQHMHIGAQQYNIEDVSQETLNNEPPLDTMPQNIQTLMDDAIDESLNVDFNHSQEHTNPSENSIEETNIFGNMNDSEASNKEEHDNLKGEENSEDNSTHHIRQETHVESTRLVEETTAEDMFEKSRELVNDKVPLNSMTTEPPSEFHRENKPLISIRQETDAEPSTNAEADIENYSQSESVEETFEKSDIVNSNEANEQQMNKNETLVASKSVEESDNVSNITHMKEPEVLLENVDEPKPEKPKDSLENGYITELVEND
ncbi:hypothetical protein TanjilG_30872 [Lupinus angustifolius]|uniref:Uncharacterized protein n=1 Tax=Lupinus angustifolius TaxID=3871 RepID=A0A394D8M3_LUPAN|nr:PREDICTED: uncharacterized protein LOC109337559 [Lupinus angustifolius]OIW19938.1 hypothetical protein TanjilG_30872 [Lupinus angustifolius]